MSLSTSARNWTGAGERKHPNKLEPRPSHRCDLRGCRNAELHCRCHSEYEAILHLLSIWLSILARFAARLPRRGHASSFDRWTLGLRHSAVLRVGISHNSIDGPAFHPSLFRAPRTLSLG